MVEIAIAVAVIAFALVAILGLLPLGMETQRDNRELTIINEDGAYLMEAIRGGATNLNDLVNFVESVNGVRFPPTGGADAAYVITNLCQVNATNTAVFRSISGSAASRSPAVADFAFHYMVRCTVVPARVDNAVAYSDVLAHNLYDVRLAFYWPILPGQTDVRMDTARRQVLRTVVSGQVDANGFLNTSLFRNPAP
jgi:hypothetical protein